MARYPHLRLALVEDSHHVLLGRFPQHRLGVVRCASLRRFRVALVEPLNEECIGAIAARDDSLWRAALETLGIAGRELAAPRRSTR
jgi:hypothetical protein